MQETRVQPLGQEDPLENVMATHSSILAWKIPWTGWATVHRVAKELAMTEWVTFSVFSLLNLVQQPILITVLCAFEKNILLLDRESESHSVTSDSLRPHRLYSPWNSLGQNTGVGNLPFLSPGDLPNPGIKPRPPALQADSLPAEP